MMGRECDLGNERDGLSRNNMYEGVWMFSPLAPETIFELIVG